jgi:transcriptional regulator with XRE-family HTH domain
MNVHLGEIITKWIKEKGINKSELARKLEIKPQSVDYILKQRGMHTEQLETISKALGHNFFTYFIFENTTTNKITISIEVEASELSPELRKKLIKEIGIKEVKKSDPETL